MSENQITPFPSVPTQVVAEVTFPKFVNNLGIIPTSYKDSMSYYECLAWLCKYLEETVIPSVNQNGNAVQELQNLYTQLLEYCENYFTDLNVQTEINNKLDDMVEDGTLAEIINEEIFADLNTAINANTSNIGDLTNLSTTAKNNLVSAINEVDQDMSSSISSINTNLTNISNDLYNQKLEKLRKKYSINDIKFSIPAEFDSFLKNNLSIFYNQYNNFRAYIDPSLFKNTSGTTYYISPNGNNSNPGTDKSAPKLSFMSAYNACSDGDTIILLNGFYDRQKLQTDAETLSKHINIIGESEDGVLIKGNADLSWTQNDTYTNVYQTSRSATTDVNFSLNYKDFIHLTEVASLDQVANTKWSWCLISGVVYVNTDNIVPDNSNIFVSVDYNNPFFNFGNFASSGKIYFENITLLNASKGGISIVNNSSNSIYVGLKNCKIYNVKSSTYSKDNFSNVGCYSYCENVICNNGGKDGFNYHSGTNLPAIGIEYNCSANTFGIGRTSSSQLSNNASTCHDTSEIIRINGDYGTCNGSVLADVNNAKSLNLNCSSFDSLGDIAGKSEQIVTTDSATAYAYNCYFKGTGLYSMLASGSSHIYYKDTIYDNKSGNCTELN